MKEEAIQWAREEYAKIKKEKETLLSYKDELAKLSEDKNVKKFLELSKLVDMDYIGPSEETMVRRAYESVPSVFFGNSTINSNQIMIYMGSYIINDLSEKSGDYITYESDPNTSYKSYMDLETTEVHNINKEECSNFETEYLTLYLSISEYSEVEFYKKYCELQTWFKTQLLHHSQSDVIKELQTKYSRKYVTLCPSFHKIDIIADLPIDEYIKRYPEDGFIENYCLTKEEYMRVKLYRKQLNKKSI